MGLSRRGLLGGLIGTLAAPAVIRNAKLLMIVRSHPKDYEIKFNYLTLSDVTRESIRLWKNNNALLNMLNEQHRMDVLFAQGEQWTGQQLRIKLPTDFRITKGPSSRLG